MKSSLLDALGVRRISLYIFSRLASASRRIFLCPILKRSAWQIFSKVRSLVHFTRITDANTQNRIGVVTTEDTILTSAPWLSNIEIDIWQPWCSGCNEILCSDNPKKFYLLKIVIWCCKECLPVRECPSHPASLWVRCLEATTTVSRDLLRM